MALSGGEGMHPKGVCRAAGSEALPCLWMCVCACTNVQRQWLQFGNANSMPGGCFFTWIFSFDLLEAPLNWSPHLTSGETEV